MSRLGEVVALSVAMFAASFLAGLMPLIAKVNQRILEIFNILSCGLLLGTGLSIVVPEGIESVYEIEFIEHGSFMSSRRFFLASSLVSGFLFMIFVEYFGTSHPSGHGHSHSPSKNGYQKINHFVDDAPESKSKGLTSGSVAIGLMVHATADGVAIGSAAVSGEQGSVVSMNMLIFAAILCHKIPASTSLVMYLRAASVNQTEILRALSIFAALAPIGAIVTYAILSMIATEETFDSLQVGDKVAAGCLLFSGGTFLHMSTVHLLAELNVQSLQKHEMVILMAGIVSPMLLMSFHAH